jgi:threonyl-tRNA synthetase
LNDYLIVHKYSESGEKKRPVIIHRAIFGSVERMIAILTESFAGKWPFWLSPRQAIVIPVGPQFDEYSEKASFTYYNLLYILT